MSGRRSRARLRTPVAAIAVPVLYTLLVRPRLLTWGATRDETSRAYPGDDLVPDPDGGATMAITLPAAPDPAPDVAPLLAAIDEDVTGIFLG